MSNPANRPVNFNAQHSPMGAFFSFTCGNFGSRGGFGLQVGRPGRQELYIGIKRGAMHDDVPLECLPFFGGAGDASAAAFLVGQGDGKASQRPIVSVAPETVTRDYGWATDRWNTPDFSFALHTPFGSIPDPDQADSAALRDALLPAITAEFEVRNTGSRVMTACFAIKFDEQGPRVLESGIGERRAGFALQDRAGMLAELEDGERPRAIQNWAINQAIVGPNAVHRLGNTPGVCFEVQPGQTRRLRIALGVYLGGNVTTGLAGRYLYTRYFGDLLDVLSAALDSFDQRSKRATQLDDELRNSGLSADQQFLIAHSTRSYYGSTQLLDVGGQPFWIVNEGEYCMLNTLDLSVDQVFWELKQNPWVVRNLLDNFVRHYSYVDQHGLSFCHDMGVHNNFSPAGHSSYELPHLNALCFSYMTCEELCNWILIAASYVKSSGDTAWGLRNAHVIDGCFNSLVNRCDENGFPASDSSRCGQDGAEITTYDSLDHSLAQTRNNLYMVVKSWASFLGLALIYDLIGQRHEYYDGSLDMAERIEKALPALAGEDGVFPAVFEKENSGYTSRILPAVEGLMYPLYWDELTAPNNDPDKSLSRAFIASLKKHTVTLLKSGTNLFPDGGIKLSSTSDNSWMSKIAIFQHVCREVFGLDEDAAFRDLFATADAAHLRWQTEGESAYWACSDQMVNGVAMGSKYYPRIITTALWLERGN